TPPSAPAPLPLHDALPISVGDTGHQGQRRQRLEEVGGGWQREVAGGIVGIARGDAPGQDYVIARPQRVVAERLRATREADERLARGRWAVDGQVAPETHR